MHRSKITLSIPEIQSKFVHISCKNSHTTCYTALWTVNLVTKWYYRQFVKTLTIHTVYNLIKKAIVAYKKLAFGNFFLDVVLCCFSMEDKYFLLPAILFTTMGFLTLYI